MKIKLLLALIVVVAIGAWLYTRSTDTNQPADQAELPAINVAITNLRDTLESIDSQITGDGLPAEVAIQGERDVVTAFAAVNQAATDIINQTDNAIDYLTFLENLTEFNETLGEYRTTLSFISQGLPADHSSDQSMTTALANTLSTLNQISSNLPNYFQEAVPEDFDPSAAKDESTVPLATTTQSS